MYRRAAVLAEGHVAERLRGKTHAIQEISARAKSPDSVREKIDRKKYNNPESEMTDLIGIRIVLLYESAIPTVVSRLEAAFEVDLDASVNKTDGLKSREVGYRSHHLIMKMNSGSLTAEGKLLDSLHVEVQIRSVVAHAWAEIEHSLRYKAGMGIPANISRKFDALAGTLELVDAEFSRIASEIENFVSELRESYKAGQGLDAELSSTQLLAALSSGRPEMIALGPNGFVLEIEDAFRYAKLLCSVGVNTPGQLLSELHSSSFLTDIRDYMDGKNIISYEEASGVVVVAAIVAQKDWKAFVEIASFASDSGLVEVLSKYS